MKIHGGLLVKNTCLALIAQIVPMLVALLTIPYVIHGLGTERFGILSLAWVLLGSFSLFDLGLGRATTKFVAEALGKNEIERIPDIIWTSLTCQVTMGAIAGMALAVATPFLVARLLKISPNLLAEAKLTSCLLSISIPIVLISRNLRGVLEARQRFDLITLVQIPSSSLTALLPAAGVFVGFRSPGIITLIILSWVLGACAYLWLCFLLFPALQRRISTQKILLRSLLTFGGWITLCNILVPVLVSLDRFLIGALVSVREVAYYTAPYEMVFRLLIIPGVLATTLFPAFSTLSALQANTLQGLYFRSLKYIVLILGPIVVIATLFAGDILRLWLGKEFMARSTLVFQILAVGMLLNALSQMPANLLDGVGRPDLRAKTFLSYSVFYVALAWFLIVKMGIVGAALAWTVRAAAECAIFFVQSWRVLRFPTDIFVKSGFLKGLGAFGCLALATAAIRAMTGPGMWIEVAAAFLSLTFFAVVIWRYVLDQTDKSGLFATLAGFAGRASRTQ